MECQANIAGEGEFVDGKREQQARRGCETKATVGVILIKTLFRDVIRFYVTIFFAPR